MFRYKKKPRQGRGDAMLCWPDRPLSPDAGSKIIGLSTDPQGHGCQSQAREIYNGCRSDAAVSSRHEV